MSATSSEQHWRFKKFLILLGIIFCPLLILSLWISYDFDFDSRELLLLLGIVFSSSLAVAGTIARFLPYTPMDKVAEANLHWGLGLDGTTPPDSWSTSNAILTNATLHGLPSKEKKVNFLFSLTNTGQVPITQIEARIMFGRSRIWEPIRNKNYADTTLQLGDRWDVLNFGGAYVAWTFRGGDLQILPDRGLILGPFIASIQPEDREEFQIECDVQSAEGEHKFYFPKIFVQPYSEHK